MRYIALLRGINVGRAKRVAMADLRQLIAELGYGNVRTLLNSGNVVFDVDEAAGAAPAPTTFEDALMHKLDVSARFTILPADALDAIIRANPLLDLADDFSRLMVQVVSDSAQLDRLEPLLREVWTPEALALGPRVAYMWCVPGVLDSRLANAAGKILGDAATARNWNTLLKLQALCAVP